MAFRHFLNILALPLLLLCSPGAAGESTPSAEPGAAGRIQWIDVHAHLVGGRGGPDLDYYGAAEAALAAMDATGIRTCVIMPPPQVSGSPPPYDYDRFLSAVKRHPKRFAFLGGGGTLNPMLHDAAKDGNVSERIKRRFVETANEIIQDGARGFGEMAAHHYSLVPAHPYESVPADHPLLLLLADIAASHDVVIDLHFDVVTEEVSTLPPVLAAQGNPLPLRPNLAGFERLLVHNRKAKIVWAHAGSDPLGHWTVALSRELLQRHPNLYMSLRVAGGVPKNRILNMAGEVKPEWMALFRDFPDRFVLGGDQFFVSPQIRGMGPGILFAQRASIQRDQARQLLTKLPGDLARAIAYENAIHLYKLKD